MKKQTITWVALPSGIVTGLGGHTGLLNVFISPRLWDDQDTTSRQLSDYPDWLDWPTQLRQATFQVAFDTGPAVEAQVADPSLLSTPHWQALFAPETAVNPFQFTDHRASQHTIVQEGAIERMVLGVYTRILGATDGLTPPSRGVATSDPELRQIGRAQLARNMPNDGTGTTGGGPTGGGGPVPGSGGPAGGGRPSGGGGAVPGGGPAGSGDTTTGGAPGAAPNQPRARGGCSGCLFALLQPLFRLLRIPLPQFFGNNALGMLGMLFARPLYAPDGRPALADQKRALGATTSAADLYNQTCGALDPYPSSKPPNPNDLPKMYDFHHIISSLGDHPALQRLVGQVITLTFPLPPALPTTGTVTVVPAWVSPSGMPTTHYSPNTAYTLQGTTFQARPRPTLSDVRDGFLRVDDPNLFQVIQVEAVGSMMKLANAGANWLAMDSDGFSASAKEDTAALPALRNGGVSLVRTAMEDYLDQLFSQSAALQAGLAAQDGSPAPTGAAAAVTLFSNDLVRGYRADVFDKQLGRWYSLHQTQTAYQFKRNPSLNTTGKGSLTEGFTQHIATQPAGDTGGTDEMRYSPSLFTWDGWSLSAARPGKVLDAAYSADKPVADPSNESRTTANFETTRRAVPGTLPRLRYGRTYQIRVRTVDLAGQSVVAPGDAAFQQTPSEVTAPFVYQRFHPVSHPATILCADPVEGESVHRLVVRSDPGSVAQQTGVDAIVETDRYLVPPKTAREYAELHGEFDDTSGKMRGDTTGYRLGVREAGTLAKELSANGPRFEFVRIPGVQPLSVHPASPPPAGDPPEKYTGVGPFPMPYLPDPLAVGIRVAVTYLGSSQEHVAQVDLVGLAWPDLATLRLKVVGVDATQTPALPVVQKHQTSGGSENVLAVELPQSLTAALSISSMLRPEAMAQLALPSLLPQGRLNPHQALAGQIYYLTPALDLWAVHATRRPLAIPRWQRAFANRDLNQPFIQFSGQLAIHGPSTGKLSFALSGTDPVDEPGSPPTTRQWSMDGGEALTSALLDPAQNVSPASPIPLGQFVTPVISQHLDTRYHKATYTATASTRFREYFPTKVDPHDMIRPHTSDSNDDYKLAQIVVDISNTATPPVPKIVEMLPVFNWDFSQQGGSIVRSRRSVLRVYLERPWFASGDGELLGVIFRDQAMSDIPHQVQPYVTLWGRDPIQRLEAPGQKLSNVPYYGSQTQQVTYTYKRAKAKGGPAEPSLGNVAGCALTADDFSGATVLQVALNELALQVNAAGYPVYYDAARDLRFCDITFGDQISEPYFPFIRLALARFQPNSVPGAHISRIVRPDFAQLLPARTATITRQGGQVAVRINGFAPDGLTTFDVFLEQFDPSIGGDLGWQRIPGVAFTRDVDNLLWLWQGTCTLPAGTARLRVAIREFEPIDNSESYNFTQTYMTRQPYRLIYADEYELS